MGGRLRGALRRGRPAGGQGPPGHPAGKPARPAPHARSVCVSFWKRRGRGRGRGAATARELVLAARPGSSAVGGFRGFQPAARTGAFYFCSSCGRRRGRARALAFPAGSAGVCVCVCLSGRLSSGQGGETDVQGDESGENLQNSNRSTGLRLPPPL